MKTLFKTRQKKEYILLALALAFALILSACGSADTAETKAGTGETVEGDVSDTGSVDYEAEAVYYDTGWTMTQHPDESGEQGVFYTFYNNEDGSLIVIDGGNADNSDYVFDVIEAYGGHVTAWFLTHYHKDHMGAFERLWQDGRIAVCADQTDGITVETIYYNQADPDYYTSVLNEWDDPDIYQAFLDMQTSEGFTPLKSDEILEISGLTIRCLNSYDDRSVVYGAGDLPNNMALVLKISGAEDSVLLLSDCHTETMADMLIAYYSTDLCCEYVEAAHHGNNSMPDSFYDFVMPSAMLFDAPEWLMTGDDYTAKDLKNYCCARGIATYDVASGANSFPFN